MTIEYRIGTLSGCGKVEDNAGGTSVKGFVSGGVF
jgi:hypothetical protein